MDGRNLWFLFQQGIETAIRFDLYLEAVKLLSSEKDSPPVAFLEGQVRQNADTHLFWIHQLGKLIAEPGPPALDNETAETFIRPYVKCVSELKGLHHYLRLLPAQPPITPEVKILLTDFFPEDKFSSLQTTVVYLPDHNFERYKPISHRKDISTEAPEVLRMPYIEFQNPLMWANLIHEVGHSLDEEREFSAGVLTDLVSRKVDLSKRKMTTDWACESFADRAAVEAMGPSYLCAIATWFIAHDPARLALPTQSHPPPTKRIEFIDRYLKGKSISTPGTQLVLSVVHALREFYPNGDPPYAPAVDLEEMSERAAKCVGRIPATRMRRYDSAQAEVVHSMLVPLRDKVIIPSLMRAQLEPETDSKGKPRLTALKRLASLLENSAIQTVDQLYSAAEVLQEEPNTSMEIINAAWEYKLKDSLDEFIRVLRDGRNSTKRGGTPYEQYKDHLTSLQIHLRKSVETARLHKVWKTKREERGEELRPSLLGVNQEPQAETEATPPQVGARNFARPSLLNEKQILQRLLPHTQEKIVVTPILSIKDQIQPTSLDLRLGTEFAVIRSSRFKYLNILEGKELAKLHVAEYLEKIHISPKDEFVLHPGDFALGCTLEYFKLPANVAGRLEGKSTWGRVGLQIHSTAGFVDPGFQGALTFELQNVGRVPIPLYPAMRVAQICFYECELSSIPYSAKPDAHYRGNPGLMFSQFFNLPDQEVLSSIHDAGSGKK